MNICPKCGVQQPEGIIAFALCAAAVLPMLFTGCGKPANTEPDASSSESETLEPFFEDTREFPTEKSSYIYGTGPEVINLWSFTDEIKSMAYVFVKQNPEFGEKYTINCTIIPQDGDEYQQALDLALAAGGDTGPDIYLAEAAFAQKYTQGKMAKFAATYRDLGIDVDVKIKEADIAKYSVDIGTRDGEVVALSYQGSGSAMIYNAEIAKAVFGTDDPGKIEKITGAGTGNWDMFFKAADQLKQKGYAAISGPSDIWKACESSSEIPWIVDGEIRIDPEREKYLDIVKTIKDNGYSNNSQSWSETWLNDMRGEGERTVFAFFGPSWFINYVMIGSCGGTQPGEGTYGQWRVCAPPVSFCWGGTWILGSKDTTEKEGVAEFIEWLTLDTSETGFQYLIANGLLDWDNDPETPETQEGVVSITVMSKSDGRMAFCGGQDTYVAFVQSNNLSSGTALTQYDDIIGGYFKNVADQYAQGKMSKAKAIEQFKETVKEYIASLE